MLNKKSLTIIAILVVIALLVFFIPKNSKDNVKVIAIATLMSHPALDAVANNMKAELLKEGFQEDKNIRYVFKNASGQVQLASNIANELASLKPAVVVAITTPMAQAMVKVATCPVVFAAVTDPVGAGLVKSLEQGEPNITGTCDAWPYEDQLKLIRVLTPKVKKIGVLYNPGEAASQYGIKEIRKYSIELGFELIEGAVSSTGEVYPVSQNLASRVDALFLSSDNTVIGAVAAAVKVAVQHKIPLYVGDSGTVEKGGMAAVSVGYAELGIETGKLVGKILKGERNLPTIVGRGSEIYINSKAAQLMGVSIPDSIVNKATKVYSEIKE
jgi:putative tryptophan/tyrosine transport system substrate-binding protein